MTVTRSLYWVGVGVPDEFDSGSVRSPANLLYEHHAILGLVKQESAAVIFKSGATLPTLDIQPPLGSMRVLISRNHCQRKIFTRTAEIRIVVRVLTQERPPSAPHIGDFAPEAGLLFRTVIRTTALRLMVV